MPATKLPQYYNQTVSRNHPYEGIISYHIQGHLFEHEILRYPVPSVGPITESLMESPFRHLIFQDESEGTKQLLYLPSWSSYRDKDVVQLFNPLMYGEETLRTVSVTRPKDMPLAERIKLARDVERWTEGQRLQYLSTVQPIRRTPPRRRNIRSHSY